MYIIFEFDLISRFLAFTHDQITTGSIKNVSTGMITVSLTLYIIDNVPEMMKMSFNKFSKFTILPKILINQQMSYIIRHII